MEKGIEIFLWSLIIFVGRIVDVSLGTLRVNMIIRRRKIIAAVVGFIEVTIFIAIIARVVQDINNFYGVISYGAGFAVGTLIGITISEKWSKDFVSTNIMSKKYSGEIESALRSEGFGATCYMGKGKEGDVKIINVVCRQSYLPRLNKIIGKVDSRAFTVSHVLEGFRGGFLYGIKGKK